MWLARRCNGITHARQCLQSISPKRHVKNQQRAVHVTSIKSRRAKAEKEKSTKETILPDDLPGGVEEKKKRGKPKTSLDLDDLPQGLINADLPPLLPQNEGPSYPTVVQQAQNNMRKFENCVLLTRVGGFYELYFEHANEYGPLLNLKVAQKKTAAGSVSMSGFPFFQLERYLKTLVMDLGKYVAIAEEFPNDVAQKVKAGGLLHDRRVARVITPGTLIDESFLEASSNNYVLAIYAESKAVSAEGSEGQERLGLAWLDLSTGGFYTQQTTLETFSAAISRISPSEIILSRHLENEHHPLLTVLNEERHTITFGYADVPQADGVKSWNALFDENISKSEAADFTPIEVNAGSQLLQYIEDRLQGTEFKLQPPIRYQQSEVLSIDRATLRGLEIKENFRDGGLTGTLLQSLRRTNTSGGGRLLKTWLSAPSTDLDVINGRLDIVERLTGAPELRERLVFLLKRCHDLQRLVQKFALGRGNADDSLALATTIDASSHLDTVIRAAIQESQMEADPLSQLVERLSLEGPLGLAKKIRSAIDEEGLQFQHEMEDEEAGIAMALAESAATSQGTPDDITAVKQGRGGKKPSETVSLRDYYGEDKQVWIMKPAASTTLKKLHKELKALEADKEALLSDLRTRFSANSLTLRWSPGLGHIAHLKGKDAFHPVLEAHRSVSSSKSTRSLHLPEWTTLGTRIDAARLAIRTEETRVFNKLRAHAIKFLVPLRRNAAVMDELDVYTSFAQLAEEQHLIRPRLNNGTVHHIIGGRHPTVDPSLRIQGRSFIPNDLHLDAKTPHIITGPNMGGKSTFLRQSALLTIMAQVGCYIPATYAELGIVDALCARIGSADDLYRDQSTFMLEMLEVSAILRRATERSLVIMDEVGRGTSPKSGEAVSYATLAHLAGTNKCRTLFATHFHNLGDRARRNEMGVEDWCTGIQEDREGFYYSYRLRKGVNMESHALKVAKLAGMPEGAVEMARRIIEDD